MNNCKFCKKEIVGKYPNKEYCDKFCRNKYNKIKREEINRKYGLNYTNLNKMTIGTIGELRVAIDLLNKGFEVFKALNPQATSDLAVIVNNKVFRVEARTSTYSSSGKPYEPSRKGNYDILAIVLPDRIMYDFSKTNDSDVTKRVSDAQGCLGREK